MAVIQTPIKVACRVISFTRSFSTTTTKTIKTRTTSIIAVNMAYVIPLAERQLYGADTAVATNNPQALARHGHRLRKLTYVCDNPEFAKCWTEGLRPAVLRVIEALVPKGETTWILHVVRLGFVDPEVDKSLCPITLQLIVYPAISMEDDDVDVFPEKLAGELVHALGNVLEMYWDGEEK